MKLHSIVLGLMLSSSALADGVSVDRMGRVANLTGSLRGTSAEVLDFVSRAYEHGFKDAQGADFFNKMTFKEGMRSHTAFKNKNVTVSLDSAFAVIYNLDLHGKPGDMIFNPLKNVLVVRGEPAKILMGALMSTVGSNSRVQTKSGKVVCTRVVAPRAVPTCTLTL